MKQLEKPYSTSSKARLSRTEIIEYYATRRKYHQARVDLLGTVDEMTDPKDAQRIRDQAAKSQKRVRVARDEMMRWMYLPDEVFDAIRDLVNVDEPEPALWHVIVYECEDSEEIVTEHEDVPDGALGTLLGSIREKMRTSVHDEELDEQYSPDNEISITPVFEEED